MSVAPTPVPLDDRPARWRFLGCEYSPRDAANIRRFNAWCLAFALAFVFATYVLHRPAVDPNAVAYAVAILPTIVGLFTARSYARFLAQADELQRRIHLEAIALAFGVGILFMMGYRLLSRVGLPELDLSDGILPMTFAFVYGLWRGARRYA